MYQKKEKNILQKWALICHRKMLRWLIGIILGKIICKYSNWQHIQRLKITILGANWQLFRLERIAKCSYFILSTQNIKFYWFVMKRKKFMLPIWWYNRGLFPLGNKYFGVFVLNGLTAIITHSIIIFFFKLMNFLEAIWNTKKGLGLIGIWMLLFCKMEGGGGAYMLKVLLVWKTYI